MIPAGVPSPISSGARFEQVSILTPGALAPAREASPSCSTSMQPSP